MLLVKFMVSLEGEPESTPYIVSEYLHSAHSQKGPWPHIVFFRKLDHPLCKTLYETIQFRRIVHLVSYETNQIRLLPLAIGLQDLLEVRNLAQGPEII